MTFPEVNAAVDSLLAATGTATTESAEGIPEEELKKLIEAGTPLKKGDSMEIPEMPPGNPRASNFVELPQRIVSRWGEPSTDNPAANQRHPGKEGFLGR